MACAGDAIAEAEVVMTRKSGRTISDFLRDGDGDEATPPPSPPETPPRLRLPRFTCATLRFGRLGRKKAGGGGRKQHVPAAEKSQDDTPADSPAGSNMQPERSSATASGASAEAAGGVGVSMLLLLARTCVELNRMAAVRAQMEALLQEARDEASRMKSANHDDDAVVTLTPRTCDLVDSSASSSSCTSDTNTNCLEFTGGWEREKDELFEDDWRARTDVMETEVDAESSSDDDEFIEMEGARFGRRGFISGIAGDEEDSDEEEDEERTSGERDGGVCAVELERRLHELLHRRDRERIEELEAALRRAERRLMEKEMEARMWQDTATLALQPRRDVTCSDKFE